VIIIDILQLVDQLEDQLNDGWRVPLTSSLAVDEAECLRIIDQLRAWLPEEVKQARRIKQERDRIIDEAEKEAERILAEARSRAPAASDRMGGLGGTVPGSQAIVAAAEREARALREGANQYARQSLERLQQQLESLLHQVHAGIAHLDSTVGRTTSSGR
jgi:F0F1-type ATP synthase membrane subunit b/b'